MREEIGGERLQNSFGRNFDDVLKFFEEILKAGTKKPIENHPDPSSQNSPNQKIYPKKKPKESIKKRTPVRIPKI